MDSQEQTHYFKRVRLPSGRTIEVVLFSDPQAEDDRLHVCGVCSSELVQPIQWQEAGPAHWSVTLRCPDCGEEREGTFAQDAVDAFDEVLDRGCEELASDYRRLVRANMASEVECFTSALAAGAILPEDF
jgi:hypothetical protein